MTFKFRFVSYENYEEKLQNKFRFWVQISATINNLCIDFFLILLSYEIYGKIGGDFKHMNH